MNYYYLVASLPMLFLGRTPPISVDVFLALCRQHLSGEDWEAMEAVMLRGGAGSAHPFVRAWREQETRLRNAIVEARAARRGCEAAPYLRPADRDFLVVRTVAEAFGRATPAEREHELDRFRWQTLEALAGLNAFSSGAVLAYGLKLGLAQRWAGMTAETGRQRLAEAVTAAAEASP